MIIVIIFLILLNYCTTQSIVPECINRGRDNRLISIDKDRSADGQNCVPWMFVTSGDYWDEEEDDIEDLKCKSIPPYGSDYGPWCFIDVNDAEGWRPCLPFCDDLDRKCYWHHDLPMARIQDYSGMKNTVDDGTGDKCQSFGNDRDHPKCRMMPGKWMQRFRYDKEDHRPWCYVRRGMGLTSVYCFPICDTNMVCLPQDKLGYMLYDGDKHETLDGIECAHKCQSIQSYVPSCQPKAGPFKQFEVPCFESCEPDPPCVFPDGMLDYIGTKSMTVYGKKCVHWDLVIPYMYSPKQFGTYTKQVSMVYNFCRNPDAHPSGPWCFFKEGNSLLRGVCFRECSPLIQEPVFVDKPPMNMSMFDNNAQGYVLFDLAATLKKYRMTIILILLLALVCCIWYCCPCFWICANCFVWEQNKLWSGMYKTLAKVRKAIAKGPSALELAESFEIEEAFINMCNAYENLRQEMLKDHFGRALHYADFESMEKKFPPVIKLRPDLNEVA